MRQQTLAYKKHRQLRLAMVLKAWQDLVQYKKHMNLQSLNSLKFGAARLDYMVRVCFDALKLHKHQRATALMSYALTDDMNVSLERHNRSLDKLFNRMNNKQMTRAVSSVVYVLTAGVQSYFTKWKKTVFYLDT